MNSHDQDSMILLIQSSIAFAFFAAVLPYWLTSTSETWPAQVSLISDMVWEDTFQMRNTGPSTYSNKKFKQSESIEYLLLPALKSFVEAELRSGVSSSLPWTLIALFSPPGKTSGSWFHGKWNSVSLFLLQLASPCLVCSLSRSPFLPCKKPDSHSLDLKKPQSKCHQYLFFWRRSDILQS